MRTTVLSVVIAACLAPKLAEAQVFPPESAWLPLRCHAGVMTDPLRDVVNYVDERDVVGDGSGPAGYRYADAQFLFLRLRVDGDPAPAGTLRPSVWGFEFDTDANVQSYEILVSASGASQLVSVYRNTAITAANSPADPADDPPVQTFPFTTHARIESATDTAFNATPDFFVDVAVPWSVLQGLGFGPQSSVRVWAGTSSVAHALDGDIACDDGRGGGTTLSGSVSDPGSFGPGGGTGGAGGSGTGGSAGSVGPVGSDGLEFEGGPGCSCAAGGAEPIGFGPLALALLLLLSTVARKCVTELARLYFALIVRGACRPSPVGIADRAPLPGYGATPRWLALRARDSVTDFRGAVLSQRSRAARRR